MIYDFGATMKGIAYLKIFRRGNVCLGLCKTIAIGPGLFLHVNLLIYACIWSYI